MSSFDEITNDAPSMLEKPKTDLSGMASKEPPRISYAEFFQKTSPYRPPTPQELEKERKRQKGEAIINAIGDGISAISNLVTTTEGAPNMYNPSTSLSANAKKRWDKLKADREAKAQEYLNGYYRAKAADDRLAEQDRNWKYRLEQQAYQQRRDKIRDSQWDQNMEMQKRNQKKAEEHWNQQFEANEKQREASNQHAKEALAANVKFHEDSVKAQNARSNALAAKGIRGKRLAFADGMGNEVGIYENVWKGSMQQVFDAIAEDLRPKGDEAKARSWDRTMKRIDTPQKKQDFVQQNWTKSRSAANIMNTLSKIDPATMTSTIVEDEDFSQYKTSATDEDFSQYKL